MPLETTQIRVALPYRLGSVNCYLMKTETSFVLIDTGSSNGRAELERQLERAGCKPGNLRLILLTHGDFDHTGNAAHLRKRFTTKIAMHADDAGMAERGDMFWNRKKGGFLVRSIAPHLFGFGKSDRFKPDLSIEDGTGLSEYDIDAQILSIPGHSQGSIAILTACGDLFCGDLLENTDKPSLNSIMDNLAAAHASVEKLKRMEINTFYPGHGEPFSMERFIQNHRQLEISGAMANGKTMHL